MVKWIGLVLSFVVTAYEGLAFKLLWGWFIAPTFGLPELGFWIALGIIFTIEVATMKTPHVVLMYYQVERMRDEDVRKMELTKVFTAAFAVTFTMVLGFIIHLLS